MWTNKTLLNALCLIRSDEWGTHSWKYCMCFSLHFEINQHWKCKDCHFNKKWLILRSYHWSSMCVASGPYPSMSGLWTCMALWSITPTEAAPASLCCSSWSGCTEISTQAWRWLDNVERSKRDLLLFYPLFFGLHSQFCDCLSLTTRPVYRWGRDFRSPWMWWRGSASCMARASYTETLS